MLFWWLLLGTRRHWNDTATYSRAHHYQTVSIIITIVIFVHVLFLNSSKCLVNGAVVSGSCIMYQNLITIKANQEHLFFQKLYGSYFYGQTNKYTLHDMSTIHNSKSYSNSTWKKVKIVTYTERSSGWRFYYCYMINCYMDRILDYTFL